MKEKINSVGIDIGTSTTQVIFSSLTMENMASAYAVPRVEITDKKVLYESKIYFTPLLSETEIDAAAVRDIVEREYKNAGFTPQDMDTGAVIITGETARKINADEILSAMSKLAGDFVVATAGPELESVLSARGAGADKLSEQTHSTIANIDIGGGTSNIAVYKNGDLVSTSCLDIGGRLIKISGGKIEYLYTKLEKLAEENNIKITVGDDVDELKITKLCEILAFNIVSALGFAEQNSSHKMLYTNSGNPLENPKIDGITLSGGVADFAYNPTENDPFCFGDIGVILGKCVAQAIENFGINLHKSDETIRATVVGAGTHTTQVTGSTICYTNGVLPIKNIPVIRMSDELILQRNLYAHTEQIAISLSGKNSRTFLAISRLAEFFVSEMAEEISAKLPLIIIVEADIAKALGNAILAKIQREIPLICIDGISAKTGDYIDIGQPLMGGKILPVVVKTLIFNT